MQPKHTQTIGKYLITPLTREIAGTATYAASVSIRRGMHDRVVRFTPRFPSEEAAVQYAIAEGRSMALRNRLA